MSNNQIDQAYETVSVEFSNPLPVVREYTIGAMNKLFTLIRKDSTQKVTEIGQRLTATNIQKQFSMSTVNSLTSRERTYSDLMNVKVFVPMVLKPKVKMLDYGKHLTNAMTASLDIIDFGGEEAKQTLYTMIGNPAKLRDIAPPVRDVASQQVKLEKWMVELKAEYGKLASATGTVTERPIKDAYGRSEDYIEVNNICLALFNKRQELLSKLPTFQERVKEVNNAADKLLQLVNTNDNYVVGTVAGQRISQLLYQFAMEIEYIGSVCYAVDAYLISVRDSNIRLQVLRK